MAADNINSIFIDNIILNIQMGMDRKGRGSGGCLSKPVISVQRIKLLLRRKVTRSSAFVRCALGVSVCLRAPDESSQPITVAVARRPNGWSSAVFATHSNTK